MSGYTHQWWLWMSGKERDFKALCETERKKSQLCLL